MQRILPRFFRCFLIAVLAAAVATPLAPTGAAAGEAVCDDSSDRPPPELTISPNWGVAPGEWVTVVGSGFTANARVSLRLSGAGGAAVVLAGEGTDARRPRVSANAHGTFLYEGSVPFDDEVTATPGPKTWTATDECGRAARSSDFTIGKRTISMLSPVNPGATVEVFGRGWGVKANSQVTITLEDERGRPIPYAIFGPFSVNRFGRFDGRITVPPYARGEITVIATDGGTGGFSAVREVLRVTPGVVTLTPSRARPGREVTVSGTGFPPRTPISELRFGSWNVLPSPAPTTDESGSFTVPVTAPSCGQSGWYWPARGSSCNPWPFLIYARVADVEGIASLPVILFDPTITLSIATARPGETITITGTGFSAFAYVDVINIGRTDVTPVPNWLTDGIGDFTADVTVPTLHPGAYTVTVRAGATFTATAPIRILGKNPKPPEEVFRALTSRGLLTLAAAALPGERFGAYVPSLPGDTLALVEPGGVLVLTLNDDARISVSGQPAVDVAADTPTFFALGAEVSVEVIEHGT